MRVVVTGATGNVGTAVVEALAADESVAEVVGVARRQPDEPVPGVEYVEADVATDDLSDAFGGADTVVHLAWRFQPTHDPLFTWRVNVDGSARVFDAAVDAGARAVVYASSVGAYRPAPGRTVDESWPTDGLPTAGYGREKAYVERVLDVLEARHPELRVVRLRPCFIFQRRSATEQRRLFAGPFLPNLAARREALPAVPLPRELCFQAMHAADAAEAYRLAATRDVRGAFNVAADPPLDAHAIAEILGTRPILVPGRLLRGAIAVAWRLHLVPAEPNLVDLALGIPLLDTTRARTELGWTPTRSGAEALREMLEGMAEGAGGTSGPLAPDTVAGRVAEVATGVGER